MSVGELIGRKRRSVLWRLARIEKELSASLLINHCVCVCVHTAGMYTYTAADYRYDGRNISYLVAAFDGDVHFETGRPNAYHSLY